jgi:antitoxin (DNA-binding transcriptional repressor) of toxin-antitoxin stability system
MYQMRKASVCDLRYRFSEVERLLEDGEEIEITKRSRAIARLTAGALAHSATTP